MNNIIIDVTQAKAFIIEVCKKISVPINEAKILSEILIESDLRGIVTHGIVRLPAYVERIRKGGMEPKLNFKVENQWSWGGVLDAGNGIGQVAAYKGMEWTINKAEQNGIGFATMRMSNHLGAANYYPLMAIDKGMIGIIGTNSAPNMAPTGGREPKIGNNPLAVAVPNNGDPILLDISFSSTARGRISKLQREGKNIPIGWAIDKSGKPTTDPSEAIKGAILPFGDHKGYGLSLIVDLIAGVLSGGSYGPFVKQQFDYSGPRNVGHFFIVIDISYFMPVDEYKERVKHYVDALHDTLPALDSTGVKVPGEGGYQRKKNQIEEGITYHESTINLLNKLANELNISPII